MGPPARLRWEPRFRNAGWPWAWFLRRTGLWAIPMPWRVVHVIPEKVRNEILREHERVHYEQMEREGTIWWHVKYFVFLAIHGYRNNPYEVAAYKRYGGRDENYGEKRQVAG